MSATKFPQNDPDGSGVDPRVARSRAKVLEAATELLIDGGPRALTVDAVSERSGVAKSTLYRHFPSRRDLLIETVHCNFPRVMESLPEGDFETALRAALTEVAEAFNDPSWRRIFPALLSLKAAHPEIEHLNDADRAAKLALLQDLLDRGVADGHLAERLDAAQVLPMLVGPLVFVALNPAHGNPIDFVDAVANQFLRAHRD